MGEEWSEERIVRLIQKVCDEENRDLRDVVSWVRLQILKEKKKEEFYEKLKGTLIGQAVIVVLGGLLVVTGLGVVEWLKRHIK